jgi:hypothetical protein
MRLLFTLCISLLAAIHIGAQMPNQPLDTVYLLSGKTVAGYVKDTSAEQVRMMVPRKGSFKTDFIDQELVFSIKYGQTKQEVVVYRQDTLFENYYTQREMRYFLQGERDARASYRCPAWTIGAFVVGAACGYSKSIFGLIPVFGYGVGTAAFRIPIRSRAISNPNYLKYDTYLLGYEKYARQRRTLRSLSYGGIGFGLGLVSAFIFRS